MAWRRLTWKHSSVGRASALQAEGHRFEPYCFHQLGPVVQLVRTLACHARGQGFESPSGRHLCLCSSVGRAEDWKSSCRWFNSDRRHFYADLAHLVERHLAKVEVASSSLVTRSIRRHSQAVRQRSAKPLSPVRFRVAPPKNPARKCGIFTFYLLPLHSYLKWQDFLGSNR